MVGDGPVIDLFTSEEIRALLAIVLITHGGTELTKRFCRTKKLVNGQWSPRFFAFIIGTLSGMSVWPNGAGLQGWHVGLAIGLGWPTLYALALAYIRIKWPQAADYISGKEKL